MSGGCREVEPGRQRQHVARLGQEELAVAAGMLEAHLAAVGQHVLGHAGPPDERASTPGPTASTTPDHSWPGMDGKPVRSQPAIISRSVAQMPQHAVRMRTCPGPARASGSLSQLQRARARC